MRGVGLLALILGVPVAFAACGGKASHESSASDDHGAGAAAGSGGTMQNGMSSGGQAAMTGTGGNGTGGAGATAGSGGMAGRLVSSGGDGNTGAVAGAASAGRAGSGGMSMGGKGGGAGGMHAAAGKSAGGAGGSAPTMFAPPTMDQTWHYTSGDPLNSTPPVLLAVDDDVMLAGASADPATVGVDAFAQGVTSEAFLMRMSQGKALWSKPLKDAGLPWAIARSGGDVIVEAPYLPDMTQVSTSFVGPRVYLAKFGLDGTVGFETNLAFDAVSSDEWIATYGMAVDASGAIYLAGTYADMNGGEHVIVVKCDADGNKLWEKPFPHAGTQGIANAAAVLASGDIVVTGDFDQTLSFGGTTQTLTVNGQLPDLPTGFMVRLTPDGDPVWSAQFGGDDFTVGNALTPLDDGGFLLAGSNALDLEIGGLKAKGAPFTPTDTQTFPPTAAFIARLDGDGKASWLALEQASEFSYAVATDGSGTAFLGTNGTMGADDYLRTYDLASGKPAQVMSGSATSDIQSTSLAVAPSGAVWVSGIFSMGADFGNADVLESTAAGVFLIELNPK